MTYHIIDLVRERANEKDWDLIFDSGPHGDCRTLIWEHPILTATGRVAELKITFSPDGRLTSAEQRYDGIPCRRVNFPTSFASTDVCIEVLQMIADRGAMTELTDPPRDAQFAAILGPLWATLG